MQADSIPILFNTVIRARDQEGAHIRRAAGFLARLRWHNGTKESPVTMFRAGRKAPAATQLEAAINMLNLAHRHIGRRNQYRRIIFPYFLRSAIVKQGNLPVMHGNNAINPGNRHITLGQLHLDIIKNLRVQLVTVITAGL